MCELQVVDITSKLSRSSSANLKQTQEIKMRRRETNLLDL
jgi:hypothetical protein